MNKIFQLVFVLSLLFNNAAWSNNLTAKVLNQKVPLGEAFELTISYDGDDSSSLQPDLSALQNDFTVYSTSTRMQSSFINGKMDFKRDWIVTLMPKNEGKVSIPAISLGQHKTEPIELEVVAAGTVVTPAANGAQPQKQTNDVAANFALSLEMQNITPFVQQEINAVLTLEDNKGLDLSAEPTFEDNTDWLIKVLDKPEVITKDGKRIIKFFYALFPQRSGQLQTPIVHIDGSYMSFDDANMPMPRTNSFFNMFDFDLSPMFGTRKPVHLVTKAKTINVKPIPEVNKNYWWLPADALTLTARWSDERPVFKVGEAVSREIVLTASGVADSQLPDLSFGENPDLKQYPEKPQLTSISRNNKIVSQSVVRVVYIPQKASRQVIPEISVPWYNVAKKQIEFAQIKAEEMVIGGDAGEKTAASSNATAAANMAAGGAKAASQPLSSALGGDNEKSDWYKLILAFGAGIFISLLLFYINKSSNEPKVSAIVKRVEKDLLERDYRSLRDDLLVWGQKAYPNSNIRNLNELSAAVAEPQFSAQMEILNSILYAGNTAILDKSEIISRLKNYAKQGKKNAATKPLPDLYK